METGGTKQKELIPFSVHGELSTAHRMALRASLRQTGFVPNNVFVVNARNIVCTDEAGVPLYIRLTHIPKRKRERTVILKYLVYSFDAEFLASGWGRICRNFIKARTSDPHQYPMPTQVQIS